MSEKWRPFRPFESLLSHFGAHLVDPGDKKSVWKPSKGNFVGIVKTLIFLLFFWFLGVWALKGAALRGSGGQLGTHEEDISCNVT